LSIGDREFCKYTKDRLNQYCQLYDYDLQYVTEIIDERYPIIWQKTLAVRNCLNMRKENGQYKYKVVVWFDDDIYLTNLKYRIEDFLNISDNKSIIFPRDIVKNNWNHYINSGNYIVKNNEIGRVFINDTIKGINLFNGYFRNNLNHEQSVSTYLYFSKEKYAENMMVLPYGVFQSFYITNLDLYKKFKSIIYPFHSIHGTWRHKDYCIHFATLPSDVRLKLCKRISKYDKKVYDCNISEPKYYYITSRDYTGQR